MLRFFFIACLLFTQLSSFSQDTLVYFFDKDLNGTSRDKAFYAGIGSKQQGKFKFYSYVVETGVPLFRGWFTDSTLAIKEGLFTYYDSAGIEESEGIYRNNKEEGYWVSWYGGYVSDSNYYENGQSIIKTNFLYHDSGRIASRTSHNTRDSIMESVEWYPNGELKTEFKTDKGNGYENRYYPSGQAEAILRFSNGILTYGKYYNPDGREMTREEIAKNKRKSGNGFFYSTRRSPMFPGGMTAFNSFFRQNFKLVAMNSGSGMQEVTVSFYLDKAGFAYDIKVDGGNSDLRNALYNVFRRMPAWEMNGFPGYGPVVYNFNMGGRSGL